MSTIEQRLAAPLDASGRAARTSWAPLIVTAVLTTLLLGVSGFLFGTVQGDIPWPATPAEETVYYTARGLGWGAAAVAFAGAITVAVFPPSLTRGVRWFWGVVTLIGSGFLGAIAFFTAYAFAQANYLFAFTS